MLATLVGLSLLLALVGGIATFVGCLLAQRLRARQVRRHPQQAAFRERTRQTRRLAAEWPLLAQTLGLGYRDQWTRWHRFPAAEVAVDDQGVTAAVSAIAGTGLADYQRAASYLADTWGCVSVRAEQQGPGPDPARRPAPRPASCSGAGRSVGHGMCVGWCSSGASPTARRAAMSASILTTWSSTWLPTGSKSREWRVVGSGQLAVRGRQWG
jgi:hypothetical protein